MICKERDIIDLQWKSPVKIFDLIDEKKNSYRYAAFLIDSVQFHPNELLVSSFVKKKHNTFSTYILINEQQRKKLVLLAFHLFHLSCMG